MLDCVYVCSNLPLSLGWKEEMRWGGRWSWERSMLFACTPYRVCAWSSVYAYGSPATTPGLSLPSRRPSPCPHHPSRHDEATSRRLRATSTAMHLCQEKTALKEEGEWRETVRGCGWRIKRTLEITKAFERQVQYRGGRREIGKQEATRGERLKWRKTVWGNDTSRGRDGLLDSYLF